MFAAKNEFFTPSQGYQISRSVRLRSSASAYFSRTPASAGNRKTWTWSGWVKRGSLGGNLTLFSSGSGSAIDTNWLGFVSSDSLSYSIQDGTYYLATTQVFRDPSAWYHIVLATDTTQATASNRAKMYVNGVQVTAFSTATYATQNLDQVIGAANLTTVGAKYRTAVQDYFDGYLTEINFIDGQALTPTSFGQFNSVTGVWQPLKYTGTYGTNGFYLNFSDNSGATATTIGKDYSGNGNNWTPNNISVTSGTTYDSMLDVPTLYADGGNGRGNYAVLNPLDTGATVSDGNITFAGPTGNATTRATIGITSGKWYWEVTANAVPAGLLVGIANSSATLSQYLGQNANGWSYCGDGNKYTNASGSAYGATYTTNDVIGVAFDADAGTLVFYKNNSSQGTAFSSLTSGPYFPAIGDGASGSVVSAWANFGQRPFTYTPPSGYAALNTQNLPAPTISNGALYMAATLYTGNGATGQSVVNSGNNTAAISFKPDFVWVKVRSTAGTDHYLADSVRGATKYLQSDTTAAEGTNNGITAFNSNGFSVGAVGDTNTNGATIVGWQWQAGAGSSSSNTSGSITSTVSVNATAGFSIVTYTGTGANATVGHGLGVAPNMVIVKERNAVRGWPVYHSSLTSATYYVDLQTTAAQASASSIWNSTAPTSTVFSIGTDTGTNQSTGTYVAYCFSAVAGYSAFGSYTGNGNSTDGPFVYLGFRPRFILYKNASFAGTSWAMLDSSRNTYNVENARLFADSSGAEDTSVSPMDFTSNGFKVRSTNDGVNRSGDTIIYAAFAENPFKLALAR